MLEYSQYVRARSLEEAYTLYQKRNNRVIGGMLWLKMQNLSLGTMIDLCDLGLDYVEEKENEFRIGAYTSLRTLETNEALNTYTKGAFRDSVKHIVGIQFRNTATLGGSIFGRYGFSDVMTVFRAMGAKVRLYKSGIVDLDTFMATSRTVRDIVVELIVPKNVEKIVYLSLRNEATDFPVLTTAVSVSNGKVTAVVGAAPSIAKAVEDEENVLQGGKNLSDEAILAFSGKVAETISFGSNIRAGADYRKLVSKVLVKRALVSMREN